MIYINLFFEMLGYSYPLQSRINIRALQTWEDHKLLLLEKAYTLLLYSKKKKANTADAAGK